MRLAGTSSWRLEENDSQLCELALFVRDAAALASVGAAGDVPRLIGAVPDLSQVVAAHARSGAGDQWRDWWSRILDTEFHDRTGDRRDSRAWVRQRINEHQALCDPPAFGSLEDRSALQAAARACFASFREWESSHPRGRDGGPVTPLDRSLVRKTAEDVAFDRRVNPDAVQAKVAVLRVRGHWWWRVAPGAVMCSPAAAADVKTAQVLLRDAFDSYVMRQA